MSQENVSSSSTPSREINLNTLFKFIKSYDGNRETLIPYLNSVDSAFELATEEQIPILLAFTKTQLTGKAEVACSNRIFDSWNDLKTYLKELYSDKKHYNHLLLELQNCRQKQNENISAYNLRLETALKRALTSIKQVCTDPKELIGRLAAINDLALQTFILNVDPNIGLILRSRNIQTLNEAFNIALEEEKIQILMKETQSKKFTHYQKGSQNPNNNNSKGNTASHYKTENSNKPSTSKNSSGKVFNTQAKAEKSCKYCKNKGHTIEECRKLQYKKSQKQNDKKEETTNVSPIQKNESNPDTSAAVPRELNQLAAITLE